MPQFSKAAPIDVPFLPSFESSRAKSGSSISSKDSSAGQDPADAPMLPAEGILSETGPGRPASFFAVSAFWTATSSALFF